MIRINGIISNVGELEYLVSDLAIDFDKIKSTTEGVLKIPLFEKRLRSKVCVGYLDLRNILKYQIIDGADIGGGFISCLSVQDNILIICMTPDENMLKINFQYEGQICYCQTHAV